METKQSLCAILLGRAATPERAADHAQTSRSCPYVASYSADGCLTVGVYVLPDSKHWWIEIPAQQPGLLGLEKATLVFADFPDAQSSWSRGEVRPELPIAPCGSDCATCPQYRIRCAGCPASQYCKQQV